MKMIAPMLAVALAATALAVQAQPAPGPAPGGPPAAPPPAPQMIKQVKPGLYMVTGGGGNATVRVTPMGVILVDTKNMGDAFYNDLMAQIRSVTNQPVKFVIDTHHHGDHTGNNGKFIEAGATVIAHENLKANLAKFVPPANNPNAKAPADPTITYQTEFVVGLGAVQAVAHHYLPAHTSGDTVVYFPDEKTVSMGDELVAVTPNIDHPGGGSLNGWIATLDQVLKLDFDTAIPGHGDNPMTKADVQAFKAKLETFRTRAKALVSEGVPKEQLLARIKTDDLGWNVTTGIWANPARADGLYAELSKN